MTVIHGMNSDHLLRQVRRRNLHHQLLQAALILRKPPRLPQSVEVPLLPKAPSLKVLIRALAVIASHQPILGSGARHQRHSAVYHHLQCQVLRNPIVALPLQLAVVKKGRISTLN